MTAHPQMFPKPPRRMKQSRKDSIRRRAEVAEARLAYERTPIWWRIWHRIWARIVEADTTARAARRVVASLFFIGGGTRRMRCTYTS